MNRLIEHSLQTICALALAVMMLVGAADIIMGVMFNMYLPFKVELSGLLFAVVIFLSQPLVTAREEHVVVDVFSSKLTSHWKLISRVIAKLTAIVVLALLAFASWGLFVSSWEIDEKSIDFLQIPIYPVKFLVFVGFSLAAIISVIQLFRLFLRPQDDSRTQEDLNEGEKADG